MVRVRRVPDAWGFASWVFRGLVVGKRRFFLRFWEFSLCSMQRIGRQNLRTAALTIGALVKKLVFFVTFLLDWRTKFVFFSNVFLRGTGFRKNDEGFKKITEDFLNCTRIRFFHLFSYNQRFF